MTSPNQPRKRQVSMAGLLMAMAVLALLCAAGAWFWRSVEDARGQAHRAVRMGQLKSIGMALHNYHATYGSFPPAYTADDQGRPLTSWRVLILPWLEEKALYDRYDQTQPWNSPVNRPLIREIPHAYLDRAAARPDQGYTPFLAIVGQETPINPQGHSAELAVGTDWGSEIMLIHSQPHAVPWSKPEDFSPDDALSLTPVEQSPTAAPLILTERTDYRALTEADLEAILTHLPPTAPYSTSPAND